uniref:Phage tail tape measure protein n=1 Tax=Magnetococcus massalia (strain MO-1) TaxID=451514 RepID=A0A1S7LJK4_MAGMO|nr:Phage tail tape measure protein [Candidatus Magnetococcus massalia]
MARTKAALEFIIRANDDELRSAVSRMQSDFRQGVSSMASAAQTQAQRINGALADIDAFRNLKRQIQESEDQWQAATREVARLAVQMRETETPTRAMTRAFEQAKRNAKSLKDQVDAQRESLHGLRGNLRQAGVDTTHLSESQERLQRDLRAATREVQAQSRVNRAFATIGVRSMREVEAEVQRLESAYRELSRSGRVSAADLNRAHRQMQSRVHALRGEMQGLNGTMGGMAGTVRSLVAAYAGFESIRAASGFIKDSILTYAAFDDTMRQVAATSGATKEELAQLTELAKEMGSSTRFSASQAAGGLKAMSLAGLSASQQLTALPKVLELAAAGSVDLETAAGIATASMAQFGLQADELGNVNDILVTAFTNSATNIQDLGLALQYAGPVAKAAGDSFEETATVLALLAKNGFSGEKAGTALRGAYARLLNPVTKAQAAMERLGLQTKDATGQLLPMTQVLRNLRTSGAGAADMIQIFGVEAAPALTAAVGMSSQAFEELVAKFNEVSGVSARVATEMEAGMGGSIRSLESAWEGVKIAVGEAIDKHSSLNLQELTAAINENKDAIVELALAGVDLAAMLGRVALMVGEFLLEWKDVIGVLGGAYLAIKTVRVAMAALTALQTAQWFLTTTHAASGLVAVVGAQGLVGALALARTRLLSLISINLAGFFIRGAAGIGSLLALLTGPVGLVAGATAAVGALGYMAYSWMKTKDAQDEAAESGKAAVETQEQLADRLKQIGQQLGINIPDMETFNRLQREGTIIADKSTGGWRLAAKAASEGIQNQRKAAQEAASQLSSLTRQRTSAQRKLAALEQQLAEEQKRQARAVLTEKIRTAEQSVQATERALQQSLAAEKRLADQIQGIEEKKRNARVSTEDKVRTLLERNMSEREKETSRAAAASQKLAEAQRLLSQTTLSERDIKWAESLASGAQDAFSNLNDTSTAIRGVQDAGDVLDQLYQRQEESARKALSTQKNQTASLTEQLEITRGRVTQLKEAMESLPDKVTKSVELQAQIDQAQSALSAIEKQMAGLKDKTVTVTVKTIEAKQSGGMIGLNRGGHLPGYGGGDRIHALLEAGEIVIRKERSRIFKDLLLTINSAPMETVRRILPNLPRFQTGGMVGLPEIPALPQLSFAGVGGAGQPPVEGVVQLDLTMNGRPAASITSPRQQVRQLVDALKELQRGTF